MTMSHDGHVFRSSRCFTIHVLQTIKQQYGITSVNDNTLREINEPTYKYGGIQ